MSKNIGESLPGSYQVSEKNEGEPPFSVWQLLFKFVRCIIRGATSRTGKAVDQRPTDAYSGLKTNTNMPFKESPDNFFYRKPTADISEPSPEVKVSSHATKKNTVCRA